MPSLFDYLDWRGDLRFEQAPLNEVDSMILSQISYIDFEGVVPSEHDGKPVPLLTAMRAYLRRHKGEVPYLGKFLPPEVVSLAAKAAKSRRFADARLCGYVNRIHRRRQTQFSAITFRLSDGRGYIAYRGTDDTLIGWKENFNMSFMHPVPAQLVAVRYLEQAAATLEGDFYVGGHSKGGNLAVYAAVKCDPALKDRILTVFNNDGPGFNREFITGTDYQSIKGKIRTIVPESSVVGMLLEHEETYEVIKSNADGLLQHNGFSWEVLGNAFIHLDTVSGESKLIDTTLKNWLNQMSPDEREKFVDSLYDSLATAGVKTLTDLSADKLKLMKVWGTLDPKTRSVLLKCAALLLRQKKKK
ncbi:MAG: DUF2974 domain-containing protein [Clostridia bacterium]|nr:DUF2974 domain-containing protein [Clostridia bacterium]